MGVTGHLAVDVTVVHPLPPSQSHTSHSSTCLLSAAEDAKVVLYEDVCSAAGWEFSPFGVSTFGQVGKAAYTVLRRLGAIRDPLPDEQGRSPQSPADGATDPNPSASSSPAVHQMVEQITAAALRGVAQELLQHFPL